jgi:hypothetical protein
VCPGNVRFGVTFGPRAMPCMGPSCAPKRTSAKAVAAGGAGPAGQRPARPRDRHGRFCQGRCANCMHCMHSCAPSMPVRKNYLGVRRAAIVHVLSLTFLRNVVAYVCRAPPGQDRRHARLPRQSPAAPSLGDTARGRASRRFPDLCTVRKNSRSPRSVLAQFSVPRLPRQATSHWHIACGNCGNYKILAAACPRWASRLA